MNAARQPGLAGSGSARLRQYLRLARWGALACVVVLSAFTGLSAYARSNANLPWLDECNYLHEACWIAENGGAGGFVREVLRGGYPFDSRNPGLPLLGSFVTERSLAGVRPFRVLAAALSALALLGLYLLLARAAGWKTGLLAVVVLAGSNVWFNTTAILGVEPFVYLPYAAAWILLAGWWTPKWRWFWAGLCAGVAYGFKGTTNVLALAVGCALIYEVLACWREDRAALRGSLKPAARSLCVFVLGGLAGAWPVLLNNTLRYGSPWHNKNAGVFWMDSYEQRLGGGTFTPFEYLRTHGLGEAFERLWAGLLQQGGHLWDTVAGSGPWWHVLAPVLLLLAAHGLCADHNRWRRNVSLALALLFLVLFAWWARFGNVERFTGTIGPLLALYAVAGMRRLIRRGAGFKRWRLGIVSGLLCLLLSGAAWRVAQGVQAGELVIPSQSLQPPAAYVNLHGWFMDHAVARRELTLVPGYFRPQHDLFWLLPQPHAITLMPPIEDYDAFMRWADERRARWLVIETNSWRDREALLAPYLQTNPQGGLYFALPGWQLAAFDESQPQPAYLIYARVK